jgi:AraC family transcriptional regulator of adaptative response/methylated-DNA-[protein]-cysteine methyltransferase
MTTMAIRSAPTVNRSRQAGPAFGAAEDRWHAVERRDRSADGAFVYAVRTTGVYCRPGCASRLARRENVEFYSTPAAAERAGFRACRRCRPDAKVPAAAHARAVANACRLIDREESMPDVGALAAAVGLSPSHFHRVFKSVTGITPRAYASARRAERVRKALPRSATITSAIHSAGFGSSGRFYAAAGRALGMRPAAYRAGGSGETVRFATGACSLGFVLVGATSLGVCAILLGDDRRELLDDLRDRFPNAEVVAGGGRFRSWMAAAVAFVDRPAGGFDLPLDVRGTAFQQRVWQKLREIPCGQRRTYADIALRLGNPGATRAVARACAANPIAVAIPCHRVVRTDGSPSGYRWGVERKAKLLAAERIV